jgi:hypothetical protein
VFNQRIEGLMPLGGLFGIDVHELVYVLVLLGVNLVLIRAHGAILARFAA